MKTWITNSLLALIACVTMNLSAAGPYTVVKQDPNAKTYTLSNKLTFSLVNNNNRSGPTYSDKQRMFLAPKIWNPHARGGVARQGDLNLVSFDRRHRCTVTPILLDQKSINKLISYEGTETVVITEGGWFSDEETTSYHKLSNGTKWTFSDPDAISVGDRIIVCKHHAKSGWLMINLSRKVPAPGGTVYHYQMIEKYTPVAVD